MGESEAAESAYVVGGMVVREWVRGWPSYRDAVP
jgi:purine nucleoside permease